MHQAIRDIQQRFWTSLFLPYLTIRTTRKSLAGYKRHSHKELSLGIVTEGATCLSLSGQQHILHAGDTVLLDPAQVHACNPVGGMPRSYHMLYLDHAWCCAKLSAVYHAQVTQFTCAPHVGVPKILAENLLAAVRALLQDDSLKNQQRCHDVLLHLLCTCASPLPSRSKEMGVVPQIKQRLLENFVTPVSLIEIARSLHCAPETLIRLFKRQYGITPKAFLTNYRVEQGKQLLRTGHSIVDAALAVGFADQSQFHRAFVKYTSSTPRQYQHGVSIFDNI